jgi:hypothetical protein
LDKYITLQDYVDKYPWPPIGGLRHLIRNRGSNGLNEANVLKRVGRRILINEQEFTKWIESNRL